MAMLHGAWFVAKWAVVLLVVLVIYSAKFRQHFVELCIVTGLLIWSAGLRVCQPKRELHQSPVKPEEEAESEEANDSSTTR
mmetsp:Transcript_3165/g.7798  ORF Transcript_3165/g.7798 Transcript_3165/m.7798 type:complete len:81 (-) Transcript_3165:1518-1760(-)